jgi:hypothetical protein
MGKQYTVGQRVKVARHSRHSPATVHEAEVTFVGKRDVRVRLDGATSEVTLGDTHSVVDDKTAALLTARLAARAAYREARAELDVLQRPWVDSEAATATVNAVVAAARPAHLTPAGCNDGSFGGFSLELRVGTRHNYDAGGPGGRLVYPVAIELQPSVRCEDAALLPLFTMVLPYFTAALEGCKALLATMHVGHVMDADKLAERIAELKATMEANS